MDKVISFLKKNYVFAICTLVLLILLIVMFVFGIRRGTFGLDSSNTVTLECPTDVLADDDIVCPVRLHYDASTYGSSKKILSVNANFSLAEGLVYKSFVPNCDSCEITEHTENGFAIGSLSGLENDSVIGTLTLTISGTPSDGTKYAIGLKTVELSDSDYQMIELDNTSVNVIVGSSTFDGVFMATLSVDEENKVIYKLPYNKDYSYLISRINPDNAVTIYDKNDNEIQQAELIKTGDHISAMIDGSPVNYSISVLGDVNGSGDITASDASKLFNGITNDLSNFSAAERYAADVNESGDVTPTDSSKLFKLALETQIRGE